MSKVTDLTVDIGPVGHEQFQAQRPLSGRGGEVKRCEALLVHLIDISARIDELIHNNILTVRTRQMQGGVSISVRFVDL